MKRIAPGHYEETIHGHHIYVERITDGPDTGMWTWTLDPGEGGEPMEPRWTKAEIIQVARTTVAHMTSANPDRYAITFTDLHGQRREIMTGCSTREAAEKRMADMADWQQPEILAYHFPV